MKNFMLGLLSGSILGYILTMCGLYVDFKYAPDETAEAFKKLAR